MSDKYQFPEFDTSFWHLKDRGWMAARAEKWSRLASMIKHHKPARGLSIIKQYYMKGRLPDWDKLRDWNSDERHLDLFLFLWLHPSEDRDYLIQLRDTYIQSKVVTKYDIGYGFGLFFGSAGVLACQEYSDEQVAQGWIEPILYTGSNEFYFDVMMQNVDYLNRGIELVNLAGYPPSRVNISAPKSSLHQLTTMSKWLLIKKMRDINEDMVFQYERPLEWWYRGLETHEDFFSGSPQAETRRSIFRKVLYRIHHFDIEAEGDTCRTRFIHRIRKLLDERPFIGEIEKMWAQVKSGEIRVENAF